MRMLMFLAFGCARVAQSRATRANCLDLLAASRHRCGSEAAQRGAIQVEFDAVNKLADLGLFKTRGRAMIASGRASVAGRDACLVLLMCHFDSPIVDCPDRARLVAQALYPHSGLAPRGSSGGDVSALKRQHNSDVITGIGGL